MREYSTASTVRPKENSCTTLSPSTISTADQRIAAAPSRVRNAPSSRVSTLVSSRDSSW